LLENAIYCFSGQSVAFVPRKVFFVNEKIMVGIQLPESTVKHVEMLIRKVLPDNVNIVFRTHLEQSIKQVRVLEVPPSDLAIVV
jgi:hypothetical protein